MKQLTAENLELSDCYLIHDMDPFGNHVTGETYLCTFLDDPRYIIVAKARCSEDDQYSRKIGRKLVESRMKSFLRWINNNPNFNITDEASRIIASAKNEHIRIFSMKTWISKFKQMMFGSSSEAMNNLIAKRYNS